MSVATTSPTPDPSSSTFKYAAILDAGSTATRIYIYRWDASVSDELITVTRVYPGGGANAKGDTPVTEKKPGFAHQTPKTTEEYLLPLLDGANKFLRAGASPRVNSEGVVHIYFLATAGMRRLEREVQEPLLQKVYDLIWTSQKFPIFAPGSLIHNVRVITGKTEGALAWVALNYGGDLTHPRPNVTQGLFEVGGVSVQFAYRVDKGSAPANAKICLGDDENVNEVYSESWDGFGSDSALDELRNILWNEAVEAGGSRSVTVGNPCLLRGSPDADFRGTVGTSDFPACLAHTKHILAEGARDRSPMPYYPFIQGSSDLPFVGIASFYYTYEFFSKQPGARFKASDPYDRRRFEAAAFKYCSRVFDGEVTKFSHVWCFKAAWMLTLLHDPENGFGMTKVQVLKGMLKFSEPEKASWTLGAAVLIANHGNITGCKGAAPLSVGNTEKGSTFGYVPQPIITPVKQSSHPFISMSTPLAPSINSLANTDKPFDPLRSNASIVDIGGFAAILFVMWVFVYRRFRGKRPTSRDVDLPRVKYFVL